jgi:hypothetical protein
MKIRSLLPAVLLSGSLLFTQSYAQEDNLSSGTISKVGTSVAQFLKLGVSARTIGMGGAFVAIANDVSAIYTNAAGLADLNAYEVMFTHTDWLVDTNLDYGAFALDLGTAGTFGIMVASFSSGEMPVRTLAFPDGTGEKYEVTSLTTGISYARSLTENFAIGFTAKYILERLWHMSASAVALDVGVLFNTPFWGIRLGAAISNFGTSMQLAGRDNKFAYDPDPNNIGNVNIVNSEYEMKSYPLPLLFQVGLAKDIIFSENNRLTLAVDALHPNDNFESVNTGFEYGWSDLVFIRGGYKSLFLIDSEQGLTAGVGANIRLGGTVMLKADYAYADFGRFDNVQRFTLFLRF